MIAAAICNQTHALRRKSFDEIRSIKAEKPIQRSHSGVFNDSFEQISLFKSSTGYVTII